jgi:hypothetical protein
MPKQLIIVRYWGSIFAADSGRSHPILSFRRRRLVGWAHRHCVAHLVFAWTRPGSESLKWWSGVVPFLPLLGRAAVNLPADFAVSPPWDLRSVASRQAARRELGMGKDCDYEGIWLEYYVCTSPDFWAGAHMLAAPATITRLLAHNSLPSWVRMYLNRL